MKTYEVAIHAALSEVFYERYEASAAEQARERAREANPDYRIGMALAVGECIDCGQVRGLHGGQCVTCYASANA
jgi:hypothetical protein